MIQTIPNFWILIMILFLMIKFYLIIILYYSKIQFISIKSIFTNLKW